VWRAPNLCGRCSLRHLTPALSRPKPGNPSGDLKSIGNSKPRPVAERQGSIELHTIGHSVLTLDEFVERLKWHAIERVADVRRFPASSRHPHFNKETLERSLEDEGITYRWFEALGGRREPNREKNQGLNLGLRVPGFRAYADYALTPPFEQALGKLVEWGAEQRVVICCAEVLWWRCHRRIISDHLVARGHRVLHIGGACAAEPHALWQLARLTSHGLVYPPPQSDLFVESS
jgi:hypothetical protein